MEGKVKIEFTLEEVDYLLVTLDDYLIGASEQATKKDYERVHNNLEGILVKLGEVVREYNER